MDRQTKNRGVTLIETLIYLALFAIVIIGLMVAGYGLLQNVGRNQTKSMMQEEEAYLIGKINWALSGMQTVTVPAANTSGNTLSLTKYDGTAMSVSRSGNNLIYNGATLNNTNVTISNLVFIHTFAGGTNPESIEAGFTITAHTPGGAIISQIASTTRYIRK